MKLANCVAFLALATVAAAATGCSAAQADTNFKGEPMVTLQGTVEPKSVDGPIPAAGQAALLWVGADTYVGAAAAVTGVFPSSFKMEVYSPPPEGLPTFYVQKDGSTDSLFGVSHGTPQGPAHSASRYLRLLGGPGSRNPTGYGQLGSDASDALGNLGGLGSTTPIGYGNLPVGSGAEVAAVTWGYIVALAPGAHLSDVRADDIVGTSTDAVVQYIHILDSSPGVAQAALALNGLPTTEGYHLLRPNHGTPAQERAWNDCDFAGVCGRVHGSWSIYRQSLLDAEQARCLTGQSAAPVACDLWLEPSSEQQKEETQACQSARQAAYVRMGSGSCNLRPLPQEDPGGFANAVTITLGAQPGDVVISH